eukprot:CAMPEP_0116926926 /NCGR_PEP_ID=MMETSP0467-20121206/25023_1 /TAXON_ID=283647 /ORGANISM="Mesodinium pulex, Strain SPMC105" /LENGTH=65 /DNA_ID=CAMNT_0004606291 /DNA_START=581 /DNA_END=778 /DNA_ORIENTATION=-
MSGLEEDKAEIWATLWNRESNTKINKYITDEQDDILKKKMDYMISQFEQKPYFTQFSWALDKFDD